MATLQQRNGAHRLLFQYGGKQHSFNIGSVSLTEARQWKSRVENLLMQVKQRLLEVPVGCTIIQFVEHDGKPPAEFNPTKTRNTTLDQLRQAYVKVFSNGAIEQNTLGTAEIHLDHIERTFGKSFLLPALTLPKLQQHVERRQTSAAPVTIKKEIATFRSVWNWGERNQYVAGVFPARGLVYPKDTEKLPFMAWDEIERRIAEVLEKQLEARADKEYLLADGELELTDGQVHKAFTKLLTGSKWEMLTGYHIMRHAFISALACKGVDQRIIDEFVGHSTEEQRRRYRHLFPQGSFRFAVRKC